ncbi:hypothetical protein M011DRAFT_474577 [Sporormia fimetaria CBS 119925]|uniref:Uncharacterized protein n=1 Tax=Sporormia fimetaria CBS 119925 TaxID=1340428 RepID=A0A6A6VLS8_9PLEO|nr:hypothetical protein M011DRAFT_474577 [Sporormia fimetaria CBS 119925]
MASAEGQRWDRWEANCKIIWGDGYYDFDLEYDAPLNDNDNDCYQYFVKKDLGTSYGPILLATFIWDTEEEAADELDKVLEEMAKHAKQERERKEAEKAKAKSN